MGCGASRASVEPSVEERPVDQEKLRKAREDQRLVVQRILVDARAEAAKAEARILTAQECDQACEAARRAAAADRGEFHSAVGRLTTIATYERVADLWLEPTKDQLGNPLDEWVCESCGQVNQFREAPRCCTACGRPRESAGTDLATRVVRRSRMFEERKALLEAELRERVATVAATKPVAVQRGACCRMVKAVDTALAWLDTLTKPMGSADIDIMCATQRAWVEKARAECAAAASLAQARAGAKRAYLQAKGVAMYARKEENTPLLFQAEHLQQESLDAQRTAEHAFVQKTLSEGAVVSKAKDALLAAEVQAVVGARFKGAGDTRRAVSAQRADLRKQKETLLIQIAEMQPLVDEYRLAFKRLHYTIGAFSFVLKLRASLDAREQEDDGRTAVVMQLRHSAAEAQALEGGRQARRLGRATACLARGTLAATAGLEDLPVNQALDTIAEREAALETLQQDSRRWSLEDEEAALHDEAVQHGRSTAAGVACAWLHSAIDSGPRVQQWIIQCRETAAAEHLAAEAALTAAASRARVSRKQRDSSHNRVAQLAGLRRARHLAQAAAAGTSDSGLNAAHHRVWREAVRKLRQESEFQQLLAEHFTQRAVCSLVDRTGFLNKLHEARGEIMARNIVKQTNIAVAQQMNERLTLQIDSSMYGTVVASLRPTVKWHNADSRCRESMQMALQKVVDERERFASAELRDCKSTCGLARDAEEAAIAEHEDAQERLAHGRDALVAAEEALKRLRERLEKFQNMECAQTNNRDTVSFTVQGLDTVDGKLNVDADVDELRLTLIPSAEETVGLCNNNVRILEEQLAPKQELLKIKKAEHEAAEEARMRAQRDYGREALRLDAIKQSKQLDKEISLLNSSLTESDIAERELRYANGALTYVTKASELADPVQSLQTADNIASLQGVRRHQAPPRVLSTLPWVREGMHVSDYIADYFGAGRQIRLEFIAHRANLMVAELRGRGYDDLANQHEKIELEACRILMDDLKTCCQAMVGLFSTYTEADQMLAAAKELYQEGKDDEDDRKMNQANEDMEEVLPVLQVTREQMMNQRVDSPLYRATATQVNGRLGAEYTLDEKDDKVRVCALRKKAAAKNLNDAETALQKAKTDADVAIEDEKELSKEYGRTTYSAERAEAASEDAYKKDDYKTERECRAKAKELWRIAEELEHKLLKVRQVSKEARAAVDGAQAAVVRTGTELAEAAKIFQLTKIEAKDGWLAKADDAVACVETFCTSRHVIDAGLKVNHGDMIGATSSFVQWHRQLVSNSRRKTIDIDFGHGINAMVAALGSIVQHDLPSAQDCAERRTWIVSVRCPKELPKDGRFVVVERKSFTASDGSLRVDERHKPFGDHIFEVPPKTSIHKEGTFKTKVPMAVAFRSAALEGLTKQDAFDLVNVLSSKLMNTSSSSTGRLSPPKAGYAETSARVNNKKELQVAVPATRSFAETAQALVCRAFYHLIQGDFADAADRFLNIHVTAEHNDVAGMFSHRDVALCATLCSLACASIADIHERLLGDESSKLMAQADPIVRELACEFVAGNFRAVEATLDAMSVRMTYDPFISEHCANLVDKIRSRCCELTTPFVDNLALLSVTCRKRAMAAVDSARFRTSAMAAASELDVVKAAAVAAQKAASKAIADFHEFAEDSKTKSKIRSVFSRASAKAIAQTKFEAADADSSGTVDIHELEKIAETLGHKLTPQQTRRAVAEVDADGNGELDYNEFMVWYSKEFGEKLQMSQAHEARVRVVRMAKIAEAELKIETTKTAAEKAQEQVRQVEAEAMEVKMNEENVKRSRELQAQRRVLLANTVLYYRLPCTSNQAETQNAALLMLHELEIAALEAQILDELNVQLSCMQRRYEYALGGIIFQHGMDADNQEHAVLEEIAAGGWAVDGISLIGYHRASTETKLSLMHIGSSIGDEVARRIANQRLANAEIARSALAVVLDVEQGTFQPAVQRVEGTISCNPVVVELRKEDVVTLLDAALKKAIAAQGEYSAPELERRRTKQTQRAMQAVMTDREQRAVLQILNGALEFVAADLDRKKTDTDMAREQELKSLSAVAAARLADAREIYAGAVTEREKKEDNYDKMRDQLTQELEERNQLKTVAKVSAREAQLQARMLEEAVSQYDKKRIGSDKVDAEAAAAQDASKAQRQAELAISVSEQTDQVKVIMLEARKEEQAAASAIEECKAAEVHANESCARDWAEQARQRGLREGPMFAATSEQLQVRRRETQLALELGKAGLQSSVQLAVQSQANFVRQHVVQHLVHTAHRLWDEQASERVKERNHAVIKRAALSGQVWADKSELFHKTDERALADELAATMEKARAVAATAHSAAITEKSESEVQCLQTKQTFTDAKLAQAKVEYLLEREEATLSRLQRQRLAGRPASASAVAKWRADLERLTVEVKMQQTLYQKATVRLEHATAALEEAMAALAVANDEAKEATARATLAAKKEMEVQQIVATKLQSLVQSGLVFTSERSENEFKSLLFRKILDGALGCKWNIEDEARFRELFCGQHLKGATSPAGLEFRKIRA